MAGHRENRRSHRAVVPTCPAWSRYASPTPHGHWAEWYAENTPFLRTLPSFLLTRRGKTATHAIFDIWPFGVDPPILRGRSSGALECHPRPPAPPSSSGGEDHRKMHGPTSMGGPDRRVPPLPRRGSPIPGVAAPRVIIGHSADDVPFGRSPPPPPRPGHPPNTCRRRTRAVAASPHHRTTRRRPGRGTDHPPCRPRARRLRRRRRSAREASQPGVSFCREAS